MKKLLTTLFILISLIMFSNNFAGGSGTIEDPYLISTAEQLDNVRHHMDKHFLQINDIDLSVYVKWNPIETFNGVFDGNNYYITNLGIDRIFERYNGLFGIIETEGVVKNVKLSNVMIFSSQITGGISGQNKGLIYNCYVEGFINVNEAGGGISGTNEGIIKNSTTKITLTGDNYIGGISGINFKNIINCHSKGQISGKDFIGGITGINNDSGLLYNVKSNLEITGNIKIGGISATNRENAIIEKAISNTTIVANKIVGGISGANRGRITNIQINNNNIQANDYYGLIVGINSPEAKVDISNSITKDSNILIGIDYTKQNQNKTQYDKLIKYSKLWRLGKEVKNYVSNDIDIDWYESQHETGEYGHINCVPTAAAMAINWHNKEIVTSGEELSKLFLEKFVKDSGWKNTVFIDYFYYKNIPFDIYFEKENTIEKIIEELNKGNIIIVSGNMANILDNYNVYYGEIYHSFIIKGYVETDENIYFESYDPDSDQLNYLDGIPINMNKYFLSNDIEIFLKGKSHENDSFPMFVIKPKSLKKISIEKTENFAGGSGTIEDPYLVSTAEQLDNIRNHMDKHFLQINDIDLSVYDNWKPIGMFHFSSSIGKGFYGSYDGNGYKITNLTIDRPNDDSIGLFSFIQTKIMQDRTITGIVRNVTIENANVIGNDAVGILVGVNNGKITECKVEGKVQGNLLVGGLLGINREIINKKAEVLDSKAYVKINGNERVGGIVGENSGVINKVFSEGNVLGEFLTGGIAGVNFHEIKKSSSYSVIKGTERTGGIVGENSGVINKVFSEGNVQGNHLVGGIAGINFNEIKNSYSKGEVQGRTNVGGITGLNNIDEGLTGKIINCYSISNIIGNRYAKALIGDNKGEYEKIYFDFYKSGKRDYVSAAKEDDEMKQSTTYENWDFENIWGIEEGVITPYLQWEYEILDDIKKLDKQKYNILLMHLNQKELINDYFHKNNFQDRFNQIKWIIYLIIIMIVISILLILFLKSNKSKNIFKPIIVLITIIIIFISFTLLRNYQNELDGLFLQINSLRNNLELSDIESIENIPILVEKEIAKYIGNTNTFILKHTNYISLLILISGYTALSLFLIKIKKILGLIKKIKLSILILIKLIKNKI